MFEELDVVELTRDIKEDNLKKGARGTIVEIYKGGEAFEVEFIAPDGSTSTLLTLMPDDIRLTVNKAEYLSRVINTSVYLSTASDTAKHIISSEKLRFTMETPKSKAGIEKFHYPRATL